MDYIQRVNLWTDPLFKTLKPSATFGGTVSHGSNNQATWNATNETNGCRWEFTNLSKNTDMVFRCFLWFSDPNTKVALQIYGYDSSTHSLTSFTPTSSTTRPVLNFNTGTYQKIGIEFSAVNGRILNIGEPNLELKNTFDESLPFFYYGTMPDPRSAS